MTNCERTWSFLGDNSLIVSVLWSYFAFGSQNSVVPGRRLVQSNFYCTTRPILEYWAPVSHHALPQYLSEDIERDQKRTLSIICPKVPYSQCLVRFGLPSLHERRVALCYKLLIPIRHAQGTSCRHCYPKIGILGIRRPRIDLRHASHEHAQVA